MCFTFTPLPGFVAVSNVSVWWLVLIADRWWSASSCHGPLEHPQRWAAETPTKTGVSRFPGLSLPKAAPDTSGTGLVGLVAGSLRPSSRSASDGKRPAGRRVPRCLDPRRRPGRAERGPSSPRSTGLHLCTERAGPSPRPAPSESCATRTRRGRRRRPRLGSRPSPGRPRPMGAGGGRGPGPAAADSPPGSLKLRACTLTRGTTLVSSRKKLSFECYSRELYVFKNREFAYERKSNSTVASYVSSNSGRGTTFLLEIEG